MSKIDLKKDFKHLYSPSAGQVSVVDVPPMNFLMIDGAGDPNVAPEYRQAIEALYSLSYTLKFTIKQGAGVDYAVMPLEGLWWTDDPGQFSAGNKGIWKWTAMIVQPEYVTDQLFAEAFAEVRRKKALPALAGVRFEPYHEGLSVQTMHIGPYAAEEPTVARLHGFARESGYELSGKHHEIYLSDPGRTASEKLKTVVRHTVRKRA